MKIKKEYVEISVEDLTNIACLLESIKEDIDTVPTEAILSRIDEIEKIRKFYRNNGKSHLRTFKES